ncbi:TetR family transcriptional regulator [Nocardia sp. NPDC051570]|uniref:TetR/AcrR family transcriptional regulator n=1 Tax=Nocardia sp. NPDC051570 TaxID=3364324 RepID=UPI0037A67F3E
MVEFQRARNEEQREQRRLAILATAAAMSAEMPVAEVGLNELARRVGLAKSNVLRYFESLEAVLLELLDQASRDWLAELGPRLSDTDGELRERSSRLVTVLVSTLAAEPVLCDLLSAQAGVLERNISPDVAARFKRTAYANAMELRAMIIRLVPELTGERAFTFVAVTLMSIGALWSHAHPSSAMLTAYDRHPELAELRLDFEGVLTTQLWILLRGLLSDDPRLIP